MSDKQGYLVATPSLIAGNHPDAFNLNLNWQLAFKGMQRLGLTMRAAFFKAESAFDTQAARKIGFNPGLMPNIAENQRHRKHLQRGRKRLFDPEIDKQRFTRERSFAWIDKFRALLIRFERQDVFFLAGHFIAYAIINLRHILAQYLAISSLAIPMAAIIQIILARCCALNHRGWKCRLDAIN